MNLPNKLTVLRICMIPLFLVAYFLPFAWGKICAAIIFVLAAVTDFCDGHIARKRNLVTDFGKLLDPVADKILVTAALFCLVETSPLQWIYYYTNSSFCSEYTMFGIILLTCGSAIMLARELLIDGVRMIAASKGIVVQANIFGKVKTLLQDVAIPVLVILCLWAPDISGLSQPHVDYAYITIWIVAVVLFSLATIATIISGIIYLMQNKQVFSDK